jgi:hypothetical protein
MALALKIVGVLALIVGFVGLFLPAIPGSILLFGGVLAIAAADGFDKISVGTVVACGVLSAAAFAVDYLAGLLGARKFGASKWGLVGALVGLVVGLPMGLLGIVIGPAAGAVFAEYLVDRDFKRATKAGGGAFVGFLVGMLAKVALAFTILGIAGFAYFKD